MATAKRGQFFDLLDILKLFPTPLTQDLAIFPRTTDRSIKQTAFLLVAGADRHAAQRFARHIVMDRQTHTQYIKVVVIYNTSLLNLKTVVAFCGARALVFFLACKVNIDHTIFSDTPYYYNRQPPGQMFTDIVVPLFTAIRIYVSLSLSEGGTPGILTTRLIYVPSFSPDPFCMASCPSCHFSLMW